MRAAPGGAAQRRRMGRLLRSIDVYVVFAALGVLAYIIVVNLVAETASIAIQVSVQTQLEKISENGAATALPVEVYWPYRWPAAPLAEVHVLRDGTDYVKASLTRLASLLPRWPAAHLAAWDLLLLTSAKTALPLSSVDLRRVVASVVTPPASAAAVGAAREAVGSAAAVWAAKGAAAEAAAATALLTELLASPAPSLADIDAYATSWEAFSGAVWDVVTHATAPQKVEVRQAYEHVLEVSARYWTPAGRATLLPLADRHLLPLQGGSFDAVVPLPRLLLHLWVLGGRGDTPLVASYDETVEAVLRDLLFTRTTANATGGAVNFTFVAASAEVVVPVATPRTCALAGLLAQGVRHGAHRYPTRSATAAYTEDDVLQAAEALAASCFQQYADPAGHRLRRTAYVTSSGPVGGYVEGEGVNEKKEPSPAGRSTFCDVPALLLDSFYELYLTTQDTMYGLWSLLVMSDGVSDHCAVSARDLRSSEPWVRHVRELRSLWLLLQHMDCLVYRRSRGTRGVCDVTTSTMVSPVTGHLLRLPPKQDS